MSRDGLLRVLAKIGCQSILLAITNAFHVDMKVIFQVDGASSTAFDIRSGVKQYCVLAPTLFGIFFGAMIKHAFQNVNEGTLLHTRSSGKLFKMARLKAKTKVRELIIRELLFADDAGVVAHSEEDFQILLDNFARACNDFGSTISLKKTQVMNQNSLHPASLRINNCDLVEVSEFTYLGSTIAENISLDAEISRRIGRAAATFEKLTKEYGTIDN